MRGARRSGDRRRKSSVFSPQSSVLSHQSSVIGLRWQTMSQQIAGFFRDFWRPCAAASQRWEETWSVPGLFEVGAERAKGGGSMARRVLLLARRLAERTSIGRVEKNRVVAEAVRAARRVRDLAFDRSARLEE